LLNCALTASKVRRTSTGARGSSAGVVRCVPGASDVRSGDDPADGERGRSASRRGDLSGSGLRRGDERSRDTVDKGSDERPGDSAGGRAGEASRDSDERRIERGQRVDSATGALLPKIPRPSPANIALA